MNGFDSLQNPFRELLQNIYRNLIRLHVGKYLQI